MCKYCSRLMDIKTPLIGMRCGLEVDLCNIYTIERVDYPLP